MAEGVRDAARRDLAVGDHRDRRARRRHGGQAGRPRPTSRSPIADGRRRPPVPLGWRPGREQSSSAGRGPGAARSARPGARSSVDRASRDAHGAPPRSGPASPRPGDGPCRSRPASGSTSSAPVVPGRAGRPSLPPRPGRGHGLRCGRAVAVHAGSGGRRDPVAAGHDPAHVTGAEPGPDGSPSPRRSRRSTPDHPELAAARRRRHPARVVAQVIADAAAGRTLVAVTGTHGKSTTAGWLVHVLTAAGRIRPRSSGMG